MLQLHFSAHNSYNAQTGLAWSYTTSSPRHDRSGAEFFWGRQCCYAIAARRVRHISPSELIGTALFGSFLVPFLVYFVTCLFVLLFDDTPSVFGYAVYSKVSRYGFGEKIMCQPRFFAPSTVKVLLRHRWDCVSSDTRNCAGDNASTLSHLAFLRGRALIYLA